MRETRLLMGMPITVEIVDPAPSEVIADAFDYFAAVDRRFSTYREDSEISAINAGRLASHEASAEMREVLAIALRTCVETDGYFDMRRPDGRLDPSGIVKGWAISNAARMIAGRGIRNFYVDAGGDVQCSGCNAQGTPWIAGIRSPFNAHEIVKAVQLRDQGIATSGNYVRGEHIYDPHRPDRAIAGAVSLTVIADDVLEADRFATAAFAMGPDGIAFIETCDGLEGYMIDAAGIATLTTGFKAYLAS
jgi:thiamine biosynthesis lipoprotein